MCMLLVSLLYVVQSVFGLNMFVTGQSVCAFRFGKLLVGGVLVKFSGGIVVLCLPVVCGGGLHGADGDRWSWW